MVSYWIYPATVQKLSLEDYWKILLEMHPEAKKRTMKRSVVRIRQMFYYIMWRRDFKLTDVGRVAGCYHHTTVMNGRDTIMKEMEIGYKDTWEMYTKIQIKYNEEENRVQHQEQL